MTTATTLTDADIARILRALDKIETLTDAVRLHLPEIPAHIVATRAAYDAAGAVGDIRELLT